MNRCTVLRGAFLLLCAALSLAGSACKARSPAATLTLATTTSVQDTGLLEELLPLFQAESGIEVKVVAVGTGQALQLGRRGDADVLIVHDPQGEEQFVAEGFGQERRHIMSNDFVLLGPPDDPAHVRDEKSIASAFARIAGSGQLFVSRGDDSGTHRKEMVIWRKADIVPDGAWYLRAGSGMSATLRLANEKRAYALCDRGTYLAHRQGLDLAVLSAGDPLLVNHYSVILVNPEKHPHVHVDAARTFAAFLLRADTRRRIDTFGVDRYGQALFRTAD